MQENIRTIDIQNVKTKEGADYSQFLPKRRLWSPCFLRYISTIRTQGATKRGCVCSPREHTHEKQKDRYTLTHRETRTQT